MKRYFDDISCIRGILIIGIVLGHAFAIYTGGPAWPLPDNIASISFYKYINPAVICFHVQGFVFIAGFLFSSQMSRNIPPVREFIVKKTKRIILPMVIFGLLYIWLFNIEYFKSGEWVKCLCHGPGHLWFLVMLYFCYVISRILWRTIKTPSIIGFIFLTLVSLTSWLIPARYNLSAFLFYFVFFILGVWFFILKDNIYIKYNKKYVLSMLYVLIAILICIKCWAYYNTFEGRTAFLVCIRYMLGIIGSITLMFTFNKIQNRGINLSRYRWNGWYGVYIYHQFILMILYYKIPVIVSSTLLFPIISFFLTMTLSVIISEISLKTKIGRFLIG